MNYNKLKLELFPVCVLYHADLGENLNKNE